MKKILLSACVCFALTSAVYAGNGEKEINMIPLPKVNAIDITITSSDDWTTPEEIQCAEESESFDCYYQLGVFKGDIFIRAEKFQRVWVSSAQDCTDLINSDTQKLQESLAQGYTVQNIQKY